ncbi:MAG: TolC family protein [Acidobacteria bacterium]|jgi:outer membrane protein TolC|nr:TolC family protein [Acidobacteriota bacterium]
MKIRNFIIFFFLFTGFLPAAEENKPVLTLESAVQAALNHNERAAIAAQRIIAADATIMRGRSIFFPTLTLSGSYTRRPFEVTRELDGQEIIIQSLNALAGSVVVNGLLLDFRSFPLYRQLKLEAKSEKADSVESKRRLTFEVSAAFLSVLGVEQVVKAAEQRFNYASQNFKASRARYEAQLVSVNDVTRAELEYATAEKGIISAIGGVENARLQLELLMGTKIEGALLNPEHLLLQAESPPLTPGPLIAEAQGRRYDLKALRWHAQAQHAWALEPYLRWLPSFSFNGQYRFTNESGFSGRKTTWSLSIGTNWTIFDGFTRIAEARERKALAAIADLDLRANLRKVEVDVRSALVTLANQQASLKQSTVALEVARKNASETAELYRQGLIGALEAADANVRLYEAEVDFIRERYGLALAFLNLRLAIGLDPFGNVPANHI